MCDELIERIQEASAEGDKCQTYPVSSSHRLESEPLSELNLSDIASPIAFCPAADASSSSGRPTFK